MELKRLFKRYKTFEEVDLFTKIVIVLYCVRVLASAWLAFDIAGHKIFQFIISWTGKLALLVAIVYIFKVQKRITYTLKTIPKANKMYDGFISGSDMIWNLDVNGYDYSYFLDFANEGKKKIAYGSSIGDCWKDTDKSKIKNLLEQYDAISVREEDTSCYIREAFGLPCKWVADPTMLLPTPFWESCTTPVKEKEYVIVYFPSDHLIETAKEYCKLHNKKLIVLRVMLPWKRKGSKILYSPNEWLSYLKDADAVFTNSYHGLLFSLYFNKPVWTDNQSNRVQALLKRLNLECCNLKNDTTCSNVIDYRQCNKLIQSFREDSLEYLKSVL